MIRPYAKEDIGMLVALLRLNTPQYFAAEEEKEFVAYLQNEIEDYFVVEFEGKVVGSGGINYFPENRSARISWDVVHPEFHGKGIGRALTQYRIDYIRKNPAISTVVVRTTQLVYPFYEKQGFTLEKTEKDFWAKGFDLYQMKLTI